MGHVDARGPGLVQRGRWGAPPMGHVRHVSVGRVCETWFNRFMVQRGSVPVYGSSATVVKLVTATV